MNTCRRRLRGWAAVLGGAMLLAGSLGAPGRAQEPALSEAAIIPIGDTVGGWLSDGAESRDGRFFLLSSYADDTMWRYDRETRAWDHLDGAALGVQPRWSPDGRFVTYDRAAPDLRGQYIWIVPMDPATGSPSGQPRRITSIPGRWPTWSPDGRRIAFVNHEAEMVRLFTVPFNGGDAELVFETRGGGGFPGWSPETPGHGSSVSVIYETTIYETASDIVASENAALRRTWEDLSPARSTPPLSAQTLPAPAVMSR